MPEGPKSQVQFPAPPKARTEQGWGGGRATGISGFLMQVPSSSNTPVIVLKKKREKKKRKKNKATFQLY